MQETYRKLEPHAGLFAKAFYDRLFSDNPNIALMFDTGLEDQSMRFQVMLYTAVSGIERSEELKPALRNLGQRHVGYGVRPVDFIGFEAALLWALERFLGEEFTPDVRHAWKAFYAIMCAAMLEGASGRIADSAIRPYSPGQGWR